jgi:glutaconyl-CoA/methylmalonyl-CoA decarboxylase subunit gamma
MKRELSITLPDSGREANVVVDGPAPDGRFVVTIDGVERVVDAAKIRPGTWSLLIEGRAVVVDLDPRRGRVHASVGASDVALVVEDAREKRLRKAAKRAAPATGEKVHAPIAGKVVKALVAVGDTVAAGQAVIVLEAMKMENELAAERGGTVSAIHKAAGQAVDTGELLVELT